ncbi:MAG: ATP synthase subunit [Actinomycetales bacterium]|nr:ATP synthase subunit [Actinomycetales bacterium]
MGDAPDREREFAAHVGGSARRRIESRRSGRSILSWFGAFGVVGWSVAIPTLAGVALGVWLDNRFTGSTSWTLTMMVVGLVAGVGLAWTWVRREGPWNAGSQGGPETQQPERNAREQQEEERR